jgi:hypothetical protein
VLPCIARLAFTSFSYHSMGLILRQQHPGVSALTNIAAAVR